MREASIGEQEMRLLQFVAERAPITVGQAAKLFGEEQGLSRSTILTMMERLRTKGYLFREKDRGAYEYSPVAPEAEIHQGLVNRFVERSLGGSITPFIAYLSRKTDLSEEEVQELKGLVEELEARQRRTDDAQSH